MRPDSFQNNFILWLRAMLSDDNRRTVLRALLQQLDLPVIELGEPTVEAHRNKIKPRKRGRKTTHFSQGVKTATI